MLALLGVALLTGFAGISQSQALAAFPPQPDCGPSFLWVCVVPGCPSCPEVLFGGTICEKQQYEKQTGRVCTLYTV